MHQPPFMHQAPFMHQPLFMHQGLLSKSADATSISGAFRNKRCHPIRRLLRSE